MTRNTFHTQIALEHINVNDNVPHHPHRRHQPALAVLESLLPRVSFSVV